MCGGGVGCQCGDTVRGDHALTGDLGPCPGHGLIIRQAVHLDCRGHRIIGSGDASERFGVYLDGKPGAEVRGATVRGCTVTGFRRGIRLRAASSNLIVDNTAIGNGNRASREGYGIDISGGSHNNILDGNRVEDNADEGIHVGTGAYKNRFVNNVSRNNQREALYLLSADQNVFVRNTLGGSGGNSLYLKDSSGNLFEGNTFLDKVARVVGTARENRFVDNTFSGAGLHFAPYRGDPARAPSNNRVIGGSLAKAQDCVRFTSSRGNAIIDAAFSACGTAVRSESPSGPSDNSVIGPTPATIEIDEGSRLDLGRRVRVEVRDAAGAPVAGAQVQATDAGGTVQFTAVTDEAGLTPPQIAITATRAGSRTLPRTPLQLAVTKAGFAPEVRPVAAIDGERLGVSLRPR